MAALQDGADGNVTFTPHSLAQGHVEEGGKALEAAGVDADGDSARARDQIERIIGLVTDLPELHESEQADLPV